MNIDRAAWVLLLATAPALALACGGKATASGVSECLLGASCNAGETCTSNDGPVVESLSCANEKATSVTTTNGPHLCPTVAPLQGQLCPSDVLVECSYPDACLAVGPGPLKARVYKCADGAWNVSALPIACPMVRPRDGDSCGPCASNYPLRCNYPSASDCAPDGVYCLVGSWASLPPSDCSTPLDAGAD